MINKNDYHYVLRRIITFLLISTLSFFLFQSCAKAEVIDNNNIRYVIRNSVNENWTIPAYTNYLASPVFLTDEYVQFNSTGTGKYVSGRVIFTATFYHHNSATGIGPSIANPVMQCGKTSNGSYAFTNYFNLNTSIVHNYSINATNSRTPATMLVQVDFSGTSPVELNTSDKILCRLYNSGQSDGLIKMQTGDDWQQVLNEFTFPGTNSITTQADISVSRDAVDAINNFSNQNHNDLSEINQSIWEQSISQHNDSIGEQNAINNNTQAINDLNDSINADYQSDTSWYSDFESVTGNNTNYLRSLLLYPSTLLASIANAVINNTCSQIDLGTLWGVHLYLPCINWKTYVGDAIYVSIDTIMGIAVLFGIISYIRKLFVYVADFGMSAYESVAVEVFK